jgi:hypothetical protein
MQNQHFALLASVAILAVQVFGQSVASQNEGSMLPGEAPAAREAATALQPPQARAGAPYDAQLAIPPGLGYPLRCKLGGDSLPKGFTFDCTSLQLKGRALAGVEKSYHFILELADDNGNRRTFTLALSVSSQPIAVALRDQNSPPTEDSLPSSLRGSLGSRIPLFERRG